jgi:retinol-binding protein 3
LNLTSLYRPDEAREAIAAAFRLLHNSDAIILDLRSNGGGSPDTAGLVLSYFFEKEGLPLFEIVSRDGSIRSYKTDSPPVADRNHTRPVFVLTSERTFSAGEGLAFVLQEQGRAQIIGETTAGAANPGRPYPATPRVEVTVPNGKVRTAVTGRNWEGSGVVPDIKLADEGALRHAHIQAVREMHSKAPNGAWKLRLKQELDAQKSKDR